MSPRKNDRIETVAEAGAYLEGLINFERDPSYRHARLGLEPITLLLERLDRPDRALSILHVAGSKGKGSTCLIAESILAALGERVGTFTSPHLERWSERFRIGGVEVKDSELAAAVERVRPHVDFLRENDPGNAPTFFDATTAVALVLFAQAGVDRVALEVGLGGRLDSTNVVAPAVTCITSIELEHTEKLGDTLAAIAGEKAGILKPGVPCVEGRLPDEAAAVVEARAREVGAPLIELGKHFRVSPTLDGFRYEDEDGFAVETALPVLGAHQRDNAALAIAMIRQLRVHEHDALAQAIHEGLSSLRLPARIELLGRRPWLLVDGAHTVASVRSLASVLSQHASRRRHLVFSISNDKAVASILPALLTGTDAVWFTRAEPIRSTDPASLAALARESAPGIEVHIVEDPREAIRQARVATGDDDLLCCAGSVYLAGIARSLLSSDAPD